MRYLTIVPVPGREAHGLAPLGRAAPWFPVVGLALGAALVGVERLTSAVFSPLLARCFASARVEGQGATFRDGLRAGAAPLGLALAVALAVAALGVVGLALAAVSVAAALALAAFMAGKLAGVTGDVLGAAIEIAELTGLLTVAAWAHARP